jgi:hypothetical protein
MGKSLLDLAKDIERLDKTAQKTASNLAVSFAEQIVIELATETPVDTSEAISNWQVSIGRRVDTDLPPWMPGMQGSTYTYSRNATIAAAKRNLRGKKPGQSIFISNLAAHIIELNQGSSRQAPAGFIEAAILRARRKTMENRG